MIKTLFSNTVLAFGMLVLMFLVAISVALLFPVTVSAAATPLPDPKITPVEVDKATLDSFNPLIIGNSPFRSDLSTPAGVINRALLFIFPIAGVILFVMIVWGGFEMLSGAASKKSMDAGRQRVTAALIGFFLLFSSYWIVQIISAVFGVKIF